LGTTLVLVTGALSVQAENPPVERLQGAPLQVSSPLRSIPQPQAKTAVSGTIGNQPRWNLRWRSSAQASPIVEPSVTGSAAASNPPASSPASLENTLRGAVPRSDEGLAPAQYLAPSQDLQDHGNADVSLPAFDRGRRQEREEGDGLFPPRARRNQENSLPQAPVASTPASTPPSPSSPWQDPFGDQGPSTPLDTSPKPVELGDLIRSSQGPTSRPAEILAPSEAEEVLPETIPSPAPLLPEETADAESSAPGLPAGVPSSLDASLPELPTARAMRPMPQQGPSTGNENARALLTMDCEELNKKLAERTIYKVSLDISPPFRPDILEEDKYEQERASFLDSQPIRQWTTIDGQFAASGRFVNIAYEHVIVKEEGGAEVKIPLAKVSQADLTYVNQAWELPGECHLPNLPSPSRQWLPVQMTWKASGLYHKPLYFEEVALERYGHSAGPLLQPAISTAHFFVNIAIIPYKMGIHPPTECQYALGYYRPGNCAPWVIPPVPLSLRGALFQAGAMGAGIGLFP